MSIVETLRDREERAAEERTTAFIQLVKDCIDGQPDPSTVEGILTACQKTARDLDDAMTRELRRRELQAIIDTEPAILEEEAAAREECNRIREEVAQLRADLEELNRQSYRAQGEVTRVSLKKDQIGKARVELERLTTPRPVVEPEPEQRVGIGDPAYTWRR